MNCSKCLAETKRPLQMIVKAKNNSGRIEIKDSTRDIELHIEQNNGEIIVSDSEIR